MLQGKRYLRGWKIDSNLATLRCSERTPPGGGDDDGGAQPHHSLSSLHPPVVTQVRPPSPPLFPSSCLPLSSVFLPHPRATWPSQYSSIYMEKINIWASSSSFARIVNKLCCVARLSNPPSSKALLVFPSRPFLAPINALRAASSPRSARHA